MNHDERILAASNKLRRDLVMHEQREESLGQIHALVHHAIRGHVYLLVGPAGAGVTAIARKLRTLEAEGSRPHNPFQAIEFPALAPTEGRFRYKAFWQLGLEALSAPILGQGRRATESPSRLTEFVGLAEFRAAERYRADFQNVLAQRGTRLCIVTKAHNLLARLREEDYVVPLAAFHDIADSALQLPQAVVISGNPSLLRVLHREAELDINSSVVYVPPMREDIKAFKGLLKSYEQMLEDIIETGALVRNAQDVFSAILGCDGWLRRALVRALALLKEGKTLDWDQIRCQLPSVGEHALLAKEIALTQYASENGNQIRPAPQASGPLRPTKPRPRQRRRVGERNPARDTVIV